MSEKHKSLILAYILWLPPLGLLGCHRFYLKKKVTANFFLATIGVFGLGWLIDVILIPFIVKDYNLKLSENRLNEYYEMDESDAPNQFDVPYELPEWIDPEKYSTIIISYIELILSVGLIFGSIYVLLLINSEELFLFLILLFIMINFTRWSNNLNKNIFFLKYLINTDLIESVNDTARFYFNNKPNNILLYLLFPVTFPYFLIKKKYRTEMLNMISLWIGAAAVFTIFMLAKLLFLEYSFVSILENILIIYLSSGIFLALVVLMFKNTFRMNGDEYRQVSIANVFISSLAILVILIFFLIMPFLNSRSQANEANKDIIERLADSKFTNEFLFTTNNALMESISLTHFAKRPISTNDLDTILTNFLRNKLLVNPKLNISLTQIENIKIKNVINSMDSTSIDSVHVLIRGKNFITLSKLQVDTLGTFSQEDEEYYEEK